MRLLFFTFSVIFQFLMLSDVVRRSVSNWTLGWWLTSLLLLFAAFPLQRKKEIIMSDKAGLWTRFTGNLWAFLIIVLALGVRIVLMRNTDAFHNDEYLSAYFSYSLGDLSKVDWFGIYPLPRDWIWQFPILYFFFQKLFFNIFGISTLTMRLSIVPYLVVVFVSLFLIARRLYTKEAAYLAIFILAFFSPDLYLTRWALHFISCTAFFLLTTGFIIKSVEVGRRRDFALAGFFLGLCYMSYASSFLAAPLIFFYIVVILIKRGVQRPVAVNFLLTAGMFVYTISPLATYALKVENFLVTRVNQIKLINGSWGPYHGLQIISKQTFEVVKNQAVLSIKSLYTDGIGGAGGYLFGNLALFDRLTFLFIVFSLFYFLYKIIKRKDVNSLFLLVIVLATFVAGMVLTIPPPAFQRISLAFPFLCLLIAVTMTDLYRLVVQKQKLVAVSLLLVFASSLLISNGIHFRKILAKDGPDDPDYPQILEYLNQQNERRFYVAAFESYGMGKILFIMSRGRVTAITLPLEEVLAIIPSYQRSSLVILYPTPEAIQKVRERFPQARMVANYQKHALVRIN